MQLGPEPIPFPSSQTSERKPSGGAFVPGNQRSSVSNSAAPQGLSDLTKNETGGSTGGLGSLVGSAGPTYQSYTSSKSSTSFPSPPSAPYSQPPSQVTFSIPCCCHAHICFINLKPACNFSIVYMHQRKFSSLCNITYVRDGLHSSQCIVCFSCFLHLPI